MSFPSFVWKNQKSARAGKITFLMVFHHFYGNKKLCRVDQFKKQILLMVVHHVYEKFQNRMPCIHCRILKTIRLLE